MRLQAVYLAFAAPALLGACCGSLPRMQPKQLALPKPRVQPMEVIEKRIDLHDAKRNRDVPIKTYAPAQSSGRLPIVIFSHGIGEDRDSYEYFGRALARNGFLAVHITHAGTDRAVLKRGYRYLYRATKQKENWINRPLDVSFVLDQLALRGDVDMTRVAVVGHSAGAFTAFAVAGMRASDGNTLRDPRVKVIVPISMPRLPGVVAPGGYDAIEIPVLNLTGTCDTSLIYRTFPRHRRIPFESSHRANHYLVTMKGVNHDMFSAASDRHHDAITAITIAFLRAWLDGDDAARAWFDDAGRGAVHGTEISVERKNATAR